MLNYNFQLGVEGPHCGLSFSPSVTDWQAGEGGRHLSLLLSLPSFLSSSLLPFYYQLLYCTAWHLDQAACQSFCPHLFDTIEATFHLLSDDFTKFALFFHQLMSDFLCVLLRQRKIFMWQILKQREGLEVAVQEYFIFNIVLTSLQLYKSQILTTWCVIP